MPIYKYRCQKCDMSAEVLRTFDEYRVPPTADECIGAPPDGEDPPCDHEWEREISGKLSVSFGGGWGRYGGKGKGHWLVLFSLAGLCEKLLNLN